MHQCAMGNCWVVTQAIFSSQPSLCTTRQMKSQLFFFSFGHTDTLCCHCCIVISCSWISQQKSRHSEHIWCFSTFKNEQSNAFWEKKSLSSGSGHNPNSLVQCVTEHHRREKKHCFFLLLLATLSKARHQPSVMS